MRLLDGYVDEYLDKNMEFLIDEWQLATKKEISDFKRRVKVLEEEIAPLTEFEAHAADKLTELETRLKKMKEGL